MNSSEARNQPNPAIEKGHAVILYDGVCGLCNGLVQFILPKDRQHFFYFASLQSEYARDILQKHGKNPDDLNTVYVVADRLTERERLLSKSSAALYVTQRLGFPFNLTFALRIIPPIILNMGYDVVASNRYKWFGKHDMCMAPLETDRQRFLG